MSDLFVQIVFYINAAIFAGAMYFSFVSIFTPRIKTCWTLLIYAIYLIITVQAFFIFGDIWINLVIHLFAYFALTFLFSGKVSTKIIFALFIYAASMLADALAFLGLNYVSYSQYGIPVLAGYILPIGRTVSNILFLPLVFLSTFIFRTLLNKKSRSVDLKIPVRYTAAIFMMLLGIVLINALALSIAMEQARVDIFPVVLSHLLSSFVILLIIWLYNTILNHLEELEKNRLKDHMLERQEIQYQTAMISQKTIAELKHNLSYHFLTLLSLQEKGALGEIKEHIERELGSFDYVITTGNISIDTMLNYYQQKIKEELDIDLETQLHIPPALALDINLITLALGNALQNALEACISVAHQERYIRLKMIFTAQEELIVTVENPYIIEPVMDKKGKLITSKEDSHRHGIGLSSIKEALPEEAGHIVTEYNKQTFRFTLHLYHITARNLSNSPDK